MEKFFESFQDYYEEKIDESDKQYTIITVDSKDREHKTVGTLSELIEAFSYTLSTGKAYERERGNKKINLNPKSIKSLISNINNAKNNAAANGFSGYFYKLG